MGLSRLYWPLCWQAGQGIEASTGTMKLRQVLRTGLTASAIAHLTVLTLVVWFAEAHPFGSVKDETIAVDVVTPEQVPQKAPDPDPVSTPIIPLPSTLESPPKTQQSSPAAPAVAPAPAPEAAASPPQKQAALPPARPDRQQGKAQPQLPPPPPPSASTAPPPAPTVSPPAPAYKTPEPDLTVKYHVMLGLPQDNLGAPTSFGDKPGDGGDAASTTANVQSSVVAEFRRHLKTCSKLPDSVAASDNVKIKLRVLMTPEGRLAARPAVIEASASMKGPLLMQSAIEALEACQPFTMLPVDRYGEWKVLDLDFTPRDFAG
jgi:hypothetical protein